jgi:enoyl-CoA hydratase
MLIVDTRRNYTVSESPHLLVERTDHIVTLTFNRPESKNAFDLEVLVRLWDAWKMIDEDPEIRCAILTGAGGDFCAGSDLKQMHGNNEGNPWFERFKEDPDLHWKAMLRHYSLKKPLISAVEGTALAGGTEFLLATDIRVASETAVFGLTEPRLGLFPLGGSTVRLPRQIPHTIAMEMLLTGRVVKAREAKEIGLVGHVVPAGEALAKAQEIASKIVANGPLAVQAIKQSAKEGLLVSEEDGLANELKLGSRIVFETEDAKEGPRAFSEKRKPVFKGC